MKNDLSKLFAPPACETAAADYIENYLKNKAETTRDAMGSVTVHIGGSGKKLLLSAHIDEPALMITHIDENGFLRFAAAGQLNPIELINSKVVFSDKICGAVFCNAEKNVSEIKISDLFIDINAHSRDEAEKLVSEGDMAVIGGRSLSRLCCSILLELIDEIKASNYDLYFAFTVQKEVGFRGIMPVINSVMPDIFIALDTVKADDIPCGKSDIKLGGGAIIAVKDGRSVLSPSLVSDFRETAFKNSVSVQYASFNEQQTEAPTAQCAAGGSKAAAICVPVRYLNTANETISEKDIYAAKALIKHFITEA